MLKETIIPTENISNTTNSNPSISKITVYLMYITHQYISNWIQQPFHCKVWKWSFFFLWMYCFDNSFKFFFYSFKDIWSLNFTARGILINIITPSMSFFIMMMVFWLIMMYDGFNLFLSFHKYVDFLCFCFCQQKMSCIKVNKLWCLWTIIHIILYIEQGIQGNGRIDEKENQHKFLKSLLKQINEFHNNMQVQEPIHEIDEAQWWTLL